MLTNEGLYRTQADPLMLKFINYLDSVISEKRRDVLSGILRFELLQVSWICLIVMKLRRWLYSRGIIRTKRLPCKVISVGNIVVGGSGKTPAVIAITKMLMEHTDLKAAVISRGYKSKVRGLAVVSDGENILMSPSSAGDEPYLLAHSLPGVPVLICKDRYKAGLFAIKKWGCRVVILDDGFQYLRLARDIDIITIDSTRPFGFSHLLPRGYLREPLSSLEHADIILLTRVDQCEDLSPILDKLSEVAPSAVILRSVHAPHSLHPLGKDREMELSLIKARKIIAVCGIANPSSFVETLRSLGPTKIILLSFPDHHKYTAKDIEGIKQKAMKSGINIIVTTEKDALKLPPIEGLSVFTLKVELKLVGSTTEEFVRLVHCSDPNPL